jgi:hypothetical protein
MAEIMDQAGNFHAKYLLLGHHLLQLWLISQNVVHHPPS